MRRSRPIRKLRAWACAFVACAPLVLGSAPGRAHADPLSTSETARLDRGEMIVREQTWEIGDRRYIGGLTYTVVDASAAEVAAVLDDVSAYRRVLPRTKHVRLLKQRGNERFVHVVQGNALVETSYTVRVRNEPSIDPMHPESREIRFWLEPSLPHGIDDAWGFFRIQPFVAPNGAPRVLLTYGVLVDVGPGLVRDLFEERVRAAMLTVPDLVRRYVAEVRRNG